MSFQLSRGGCVGPQDDRRGVAILHGEQGVEEGDLTIAEREEVGSPVGMKGSVLRQGHSGQRRARDGRSKVVAVVSECHAEASVQLDVGGSLRKVGREGGASDGGWREASGGEWRGRKDGLGDPSLGEDLNLDVQLVASPEDEQLAARRTR